MSAPDDTATTGRELRRLRREVKRLSYEVKNASKQTPILRAMIEGAPDAMAIVDGNGVILEHNSALNRLFKQRGMLAGQPTRALFHTRPGSSEEANQWSLLSSEVLDQALGKPLKIHGYCGHASVEIHLSSFPTTDRVLFVLVARVLDDQTRQARELHAARAHVAELNQALRQSRAIERKVRHDSLALLAGTLAHDLNNALAVVRGNLDILRYDLDDPEQLDILQDMTMACQDVSSLAQRLKTFSSGPSLVLSPLDMNAWLPMYVNPLRKSLGIRLTVSTPDQACWIAADEGQIGQAIMNLITNAAQAGAREVQVVVSRRTVGSLTGKIGKRLANPDRPHLYVAITDDGHGIGTETISNVFEPFYSTKTTGSGLGLASVSAIAAAHEAGVCIESSSPDGTTLCLVFPEFCHNESGVEETEPVRVSADALFGSTILVLEDDHRVRQVIRRHLETAGALVHTVSNAKDAIDTYTAFRKKNVKPTCVFDLLIEGGMGGVETLEILRGKWHDIDAIACSGHADVDIAQAYASLGFRAYVAKPFTRATLIGAIVRPDGAEGF